MCVCCGQKGLRSLVTGGFLLWILGQARNVWTKETISASLMNDVVVLLSPHAAHAVFICKL